MKGNPEIQQMCANFLARQSRNQSSRHALRDELPYAERAGYFCAHDALILPHTWKLWFSLQST